MKKLPAILLIVSAVALSLAGSALAAGMIRMATTTSTANTGLLDYLGPRFKEDTGIELQFVAVGTGNALKLGENCDVDIVMAHAPEAEQKYVDQGFGIERREVMYNDFVLIGPPEDPAGIKGLKVVGAMKALAEKKTGFASRGDNSGTHNKELELWKAAGIAPDDNAGWYLETGQGMIKTITLAAEKNIYTFTDRGTFIKYADTHKGKPPLQVLVEGDEILFNQYSVMLVNPNRCPNVKAELARKFADWITSAKVQDEIGEFKLLGQKLFTPNAK